MPANYAHYLFGREVLRCLPETSFLQKGHCCQSFLTGLHGPDLLFFHRPLLHGSVCRLGYALHKVPARAFFERGVSLIQETRDSIMMAYLMGFACHFTLDSECHGYIRAYEKQYGVSHARIESELDRACMKKAGETPANCNSAAHILPSEVIAQRIALLFGVHTADIQKALRSIRFYSGLLTSDYSAKRALHKLLSVTPALKRYVGDMVISQTPDLNCRESTAWLIDTLYACVPAACDRIAELKRAIFFGEALPESFNRSYES